MTKDEYHESVMVREITENLHVKTGSKYIDATLGTGGHTLEIVKAGGEVLGIEADPEILAIAKGRLEKAYSQRAKLILGSFVDIDKIAQEEGFNRVSGILFDLGVSNLQLTSDSRGFSFENPGALLDMRINPKVQGVSGSDLINALREDQLREMFEVTLEPGAARWISNRVISARTEKPVKTVGDFLEICRGLRSKPGINPATLPFLALRIAVNSELANLKEALPKAFDLLEKGGKLIIISFHSGEDRIVKRFFENYGGGELILPREEEINTNPRARSAKMRILQR